MLLRRYHTVIGAWKELDRAQRGRVSYFDFCRACREMGYERETRALWEALDKNGDGFLSLEELEPRTGRLLQEFAAAARRAHGTAKDAWERCFCSTGYGRCAAEFFVRGCADLGFQGSAAAVYAALDIDRSPAGVSFKEFLMLDKWFRLAPARGQWKYQMLRPVSDPSQPRTTRQAFEDPNRFG